MDMFLQQAHNRYTLDTKEQNIELDSLPSPTVLSHKPQTSYSLRPRLSDSTNLDCSLHSSVQLSNIKPI